MKLWVDDIRNAPDESWTVARTVNAAIAFIAQFGNQLTEISLDHDISHQVDMDGTSRPFPCQETFRAVAWFIAFRFSSPFVPKITIHTSNPAGAEAMESIMRTRLDFQKHGLVHKHMGAANRLEMEVK